MPSKNGKGRAGVIVGLMLMGLSGSGCAGFALTLVAGGVGKAAIVVAKEPPGVTSFAAQELADYLEKISGARLPIVEVDAAAPEELGAVHDQEASILVGESKCTRALGLSADALKPDGSLGDPVQQVTLRLGEAAILIP